MVGREKAGFWTQAGWIATLVGMLACCLSAPVRAAGDLAEPSIWQTPEWGNRPRVAPAPGGGFSLTLPPGQRGAAATTTVPVNLDATPVLAIRVTRLTSGASWVLKLDNSPYDTVHPHDIQPLPNEYKAPGLYLTDLRELGNWRGRQEIELRLFVLGSVNSKASVTFGHIVLLPATNANTPAFDSGDAGLTSGEWKLGYFSHEHRFVISRSSAWGELLDILPIGDKLLSLSQNREPQGNSITLHTATDWADFETHITALDHPTGLFHWTVDATWTRPHALSPALQECSYAAPLTAANGAKDERISVLSAHRFGQAGFETGQAYLPSDAALGGTALYVENYSALNDYFQATHTSPWQAVSGGPEGCGYLMPADPKIALPAGTQLRLIDSYLALTTADALGPDTQARTYLSLMASIYDAMPHPSTVYADWQDLAHHTLHDLMSPECWSNAQQGYLRNYVNATPAPNSAELMVQIDPLVAGLAYERKWHETAPVVARIAPTLPEFYAPDIHCINDGNTDKHPTRSDCWYRIYPLIQLARAAALGLSSARDLVQESLPATITLAHKCGYEFPVFFNPQTFGDLGYNEPDCAGAYAYLMLQAYDLFGGRKYIDEARKALAHIGWRGLDLAYELHLTALAAAACARMWRVTGDTAYLNLSYTPVACLIRRCWLWDCHYGMHRDERLFFGVSAMPGVYVAPLEQYQAWLALREYDTLAHDRLPYEVQDLVSEFIKYTPTVLRSTLPPLMTPGAVALTTNSGNHNDPALWIPVEDISDGWNPAGKIGQEIYGCAGPISVATEAYAQAPEAGISVFTEYPAQSVQWNAQTHVLQIRLSGVATHDTLVAVHYDAAKSGWMEGIKLVVQANAPITDRREENGLLCFRVSGAQSVTIETPSAK